MSKYTRPATERERSRQGKPEWEESDRQRLWLGLIQSERQLKGVPKATDCLETFLAAAPYKQHTWPSRAKHGVGGKQGGVAGEGRRQQHQQRKPIKMKPISVAVTQFTVYALRFCSSKRSLTHPLFHLSLSLTLCPSPLTLALSKHTNK